MSSHREAPAISKDPVADNTDTYACVTPGNTVTIITNYLPVQRHRPAARTSTSSVTTSPTRSTSTTTATAKPDITYQFRFKTTITNPNTFLYNTGPITALDSANWNRRQSYKVTKVEYRKGRKPRTTVLGRGLASPAMQHRSPVDAELRLAGRRRRWPTWARA